ncbi:phage holin family protein [Shouchella miscanthi]|uniref:Phage holin family protein n=1 Tax=Shouchella miscanthi TaxID=2598861 RepID=A0ABU6NK88_9BACI|nr:phage holin family protein [Shouchella miscanthi]
MESVFKVIFSLLATVFTFWTGEWDVLIQYLLIFVIVDYITGMVKAYKTQQLSSNVGWKGLIKKISIFIVIGIAHTLDILLIESSINELNGQALPTLRTLVIWAYIINETLSILENIDESGIYIPPFLKKLLRHLERNTENKFKE